MFALNCKIIIRVIHTYMHTYLATYVSGIPVMMGWGLRENPVVTATIFHHLTCLPTLNITPYRIKNVPYYIHLAFPPDFDSVCHEK